MSDEVQSLLDAEAAVSEVLEKLSALHKESQGYASAKSSLESVRKDLGALLTGLGGVTTDARQCFAKLGELGMPEVLDRIAEIRADVELVGKALQRQGEDTAKSLRDAATAAGAAAQKETSATIAKFEEVVARRIDGFGDKAAADLGAVGQRLADAAAKLRQDLASGFAESQRKHQEEFAQVQQGVRDALADSLHKGTLQQGSLLKGFVAEVERGVSSAIKSQESRLDALSQQLAELRRAQEAAEAADAALAKRTRSIGAAQWLLLTLTVGVLLLGSVTLAMLLIGAR